MFRIEMDQCPTYLSNCVTYVSSRQYIDTVCDQLTLTLSKHRVSALYSVNTIFLTLDHMCGTFFLLTFDLHPVCILSSDFLILVSSVMHFSRNYCTVPVFYFCNGHINTFLHLHFYIHIFYPSTQPTTEQVRVACQLSERIIFKPEVH
jgi:hypothetical protein